MSLRQTLQAAMDEIEAQVRPLTQEIEGLLTQIAEIEAQREDLHVFMLKHHIIGEDEVRQTSMPMVSVLLGNPPHQGVVRPYEPKELRNMMVDIFKSERRSLHHRIELIPLLEKRGIKISSGNPAGLITAHLHNDPRFRKTPGKPGNWELASWPVEPLPLNES